MTNIVKQCIEWNAARYDRILDIDLQLSLLTEETNELLAADNIIDILDAIGDISFVAIGALWKAGFSEDIIVEILGSPSDEHNISTCSTIDLYDVFGFAGYKLAIEHPVIDSMDKQIVTQASLLAIWFCILELKRLGLQQEYFNIVKAICDSNDTKEVKGKTDPSIKANIVKGIGYVPPTKALENITKQYENIIVN